MTEFQRPRGTRDFGPVEMTKRRYVESQMRATAELFGFGEVMTPTFESTELFIERSGEGIIDELYAFQDKGGREIALRPELTAPVMRFYVNEMQNLPKPVKMFYFGNMFRYERPQSGRFREFFQFGFEIVGAPLAAADAEIIAVAIACLKNAGLENFKMRLGHIDVLRSMLEKLDVPKEEWPRCLHALDKMDFAALDEALERNGVPKERAKMMESLTKMKGGIEQLDAAEELAGELDGFSYLRALCKRLESLDVKQWQIDLGVVRGLDYYTGMVFEIDVPNLGAEKQVCGGGSYALSEVFGGQSLESTGFAIGFDRVLLALEKEGKNIPPSGPKAYVVPMGEKTMNTALRLVAELRASGIATDMELMGRGLSKALKYADNIRAEKVIIIGEKEIAEGAATVRDLKTGEQRLLKLHEIPGALKPPAPDLG